MRIYILLIFLFLFWSCEDDEDENSNTCNEVISNTNEALSLWSSVLDHYIANDEYPDTAKETCDAYYDAIILLKESNCVTDLGGLENLSLTEIEDLRSAQCDI